MIGPVGSHMHRPYEICPGPNGTLYATSRPDYGVWSKVGDALIRFEPDTDKATVHLGVPAAMLDADDRWVYCSHRKEFFVWHPTQSKKITSKELPDGISSIAAHPTSGRVYVAAGDRVHVFDCQTLQFTAKVKLPKGGTSKLRIGPDGAVYGAGGKYVYRLDPETLKLSYSKASTVGGLDGLAIDPAGNFYCKSGRRMVQYRRIK